MSYAIFVVLFSENLASLEIIGHYGACQSCEVLRASSWSPEKKFRLAVKGDLREALYICHTLTNRRKKCSADGVGNGHLVRPRKNEYTELERASFSKWELELVA